VKDTLGQSHARHVLVALASARASQPLVALVGGPPASGKTTVAEALGRLTGLVTLHKDAFKEPLMSELGVASVAESVAHSRAAIVGLFAAADAVTASGAGVILDSTFSARDVERITKLREERGCALLQLHVTAATDVLMRRWAERSDSRHPGHLDAARAAEVRARIEAKTWDPLSINAPLLRIDTTAGDLFYAAAWLDAVSGGGLQMAARR
jgi:predicted kinase